jgi:hypothetical protein
MVVTASAIKAWANQPKNKERAKALGARLIENQKNPEILASLPSLGEFEDAAQHWAVKNPRRAKLLLIQLAAKLLR